MTAMAALLWFCVWTLLLMFTYVGYRTALVFMMKKKANSWTRGEPTDDPPFITRVQHAHLNTLETLPVFGAIVLVAAAMGKSAVADQVGAFVLYARIAQSVTHLIGVTHWLVFIRAVFLTIQAVLCLYMVWGLLA